EGDVRDVATLDRALQGADFVFHLAALWLLQCVEDPRSALDVNVTGTFNVVDACRRANVERLVFSSSASVYGDMLSSPMTESHPRTSARSSPTPPTSASTSPAAA